EKAVELQAVPREPIVPTLPLRERRREWLRLETGHAPDPRIERGLGEVVTREARTPGAQRLEQRRPPIPCRAGRRERGDGKWQGSSGPRHSAHDHSCEMASACSARVMSPTMLPIHWLYFLWMWRMPPFSS